MFTTTTILSTLLLLLYISSSNINLASAKNYGPTKPQDAESSPSSSPQDEQGQQCDANEDGSCTSADSHVSSDYLARKKSSLGPEKFHAAGVKKKKKKNTNLDNDDEDEDWSEEDELAPGQCGLYLAPSTLPYAGLGLFSGTSIPNDHSINEYIGGTFPGYDDDTHPPLWTDLFVPLGDTFKSLPYRGQQRFPSWLAYIWPEAPGALSDFPTKPFPVVPPQLWEFDMGLNAADGIQFFVDDLNDVLFEMLPEYRPTQRASAFAPGIASLANSGEEGKLANVDRIYANSRSDYNGQEAPWHAGAGAFTPHHGVEFWATEDIVEGMELLINYGGRWNWQNNLKIDWIRDFEKKTKRGEKEVRQRKGFVEGIHKKWDQLDKKEHDELPEELPTEKGKRDRITVGMAADSSELEDGEMPYSEYRKNDFHPFYKPKKSDSNYEDDDEDDDYEEVPNPKGPKDIIKPIPYLQENGVCLSSGMLRVGPSPIQFAGRGVMATSHIGRGEVLLTSPLIAMREEDFTIYKTDKSKEFVREQIDKSTVVGTELLYNYAFTHPDSPLYLVPNAPMANFINHGGPFLSPKPRSRGANVQVRWPKAGSNSAKLFEWAYNQKKGNHFSNDFNAYNFSDLNPWLRDHPIDVMERSGKLALEYVALRDIHQGEEILLDYGEVWDMAWVEFRDRHPYARSGYFRHTIGVPDDFFPDNWMNVGDKYEIAELQDLENDPLEPGVALPLTWAHNGKPVGSKYAYVVGLEKGFSDKFLEYSEKQGVIELYRRLLTEQEGYHLPSDGFDVYKPGTLIKNNTSTLKEETDEKELLEFFAHRYKSDSWNFNMHFVAAWNNAARKDVLKALGDAGFDIAVKAIGERFGYDNMTCFHSSYMGMSNCDKSKMHSDIYATEDKSWNIVFPLITVEGTDPELDIMSEDMNTQIGVHYLKDVAYAMGDFGYHQTRPSMYYDPDDDSVDHDNISANGVDIRVVFGAYCAQIDETNVAMIRHIYDGDDPAPFADQFKEMPMREIHWDKTTGMSTLAKPGGKGL